MKILIHDISTNILLRSQITKYRKWKISKTKFIQNKNNTLHIFELKELEEKHVT